MFDRCTIKPHQRGWVHRDLNPGFSPCKGDVITELDHGPSKFLAKNHLNFEKLFFGIGSRAYIPKNGKISN